MFGKYDLAIIDQQNTLSAIEFISLIFSPVSTYMSIVSSEGSGQKIETSFRTLDKKSEIFKES